MPSPNTALPQSVLYNVDDQCMEMIMQPRARPQPPKHTKAQKASSTAKAHKSTESVLNRQSTQAHKGFVLCFALPCLMYAYSAK
eukprot:1146999-Pelagomonas_calceolata.AAC.10